MTELLTRSVIDNRILREVGQLDTTLGASAGAAFEAPTLGELASTQFELAGVANRRTLEQQIAFQEEEAQRRREAANLEHELTLLSDPIRRDEIGARLQELNTERDIQYDAQTRESIDAGRLEEPAGLNEEYADIGLTFDRATSREEAELLAKGRREEIVRNSIIEAGPKGVLPGAARFGAGLAAMAVDPVEVATMFIPVVGPTGRAASVARFGRVGGRALVGATEGLVGSAITEPVFFGLSRAQQLDYTMSDALMNVGLGAVFGGALGAGIGVMSRADTTTPRIDPELASQSADIALRQFATGQSVNISRLLDGTDLRSTTTLSRVGGIDFQAQRIIDLPVGQNAADLRPTVIAELNGKPRTFDTMQKAEAFAEKTGGKVAMSGDGLVVRQPIEGEIVRDPFGKPLTFKTQRAADKFIGAQQVLPEGAKSVSLNVNGKRVFGVTHGMSTKDIGALERAADTAEIPDGINTREAAVLPDAAARIDEAVRGTFAEVKAAKEFATDAQNIELDPQADFKASARADAVLPETFAQDAVDEMDALVKQLDQAGELSAEAKADLAEIKDIDIRAKSYRAASEAATTCLLGA